MLFYVCLKPFFPPKALLLLYLVIALIMNHLKIFLNIAKLAVLLIVMLINHFYRESGGLLTLKNVYKNLHLGTHSPHDRDLK